MKSILRFCTLLFCSLLVAMISAPAALLAGVVSHFSQQRITLADADGFWWRGSAWVSVSQPGQSALTMPGRLQWEFEPEGPGFRISGSPWLSTPFSAQWRGKLQLSPGQAQLPASALQQLGPPFTLVRPGGLLNLSWQNAEQMVIEWRAASSSLSPLPQLGDYRISVQPGRLQLSTLRGPLQLSGEVVSGHPFSGTARSDPEAAEKLAGLLNILGPTSNGITTLRF